MKYNWPLNTNDFTLWDRLKICGFILNKNNRWTQADKVKEYELTMAKYVGAKYAVFVSSGSTANQLIFQYIKDQLIESGEWPKRNKIIVDAVTWQTNVSPAVREGFDPVFIDINLDDFCIDYYMLIDYLKDHSKEVALVFPTSVLGYTPNIVKLQFVCKEYGVKLCLDNCENSEGSYSDNSNEWKNICSTITCSTSVYVAHIWSNGTEGGFIFTNNKDEYEYYLMARAHGLIRNLLPYSDVLETASEEILNKANPLVDKQFDFQILSSNYRSTDLSAFCGLLNSKKLPQYYYDRKIRYNDFALNLDLDKYLLPLDERGGVIDVPFCLPIICKGDTKQSRIYKVRELLDRSGVERRSFISGNMLRQKCYQRYGNYAGFLNAEFINNYGLYIGLYPSLDRNKITDLVKKLNAL